MRKIPALVVSFLILYSYPSSAGQFDSKLIGLATEIATNPGAFLYDLHQLTESVVPTRVGRRFSFGFGFMPTLLPLSFGNVYGRLNLLGEHPGIPQVEVFGGVSKLIALDYVNSDETEGSFNCRHYGVSLVKSIHPKARLQLGLEKSTLVGKIEFKKTPLQLYGTNLSSIKVSLEETFLLVGAEIFRGNRRYMFSQMGYGLTSSKIMARIMWVGKYWDTGLNIYPESPLVVYPTVGLRFGF